MKVGKNINAVLIWSLESTVCGLRSSLLIAIFYLSALVLQGAEMWLNNADNDFQDPSAMVGEGAHFCPGLGDGNFMAMLRDSNRKFQVYVQMRKPDKWAKEVRFDTADGKTMKVIVLQEFAQWASQYRRMIEACVDSVAYWTLSMSI
ncbi:uncharacterized protein A1O9_09871 [Exophiala aquamarina CBS 119918]|uniref:Uncharacterized protein n=1 Tax=Exophiala aquamarina CBS 119918 TaxID=1182545 RepID=A0A072P2J1_9EURO|nr:uncharacterized protein A1O9_09871 [Exophiala aquamarina CBS 119918]KEF54076.1 hypothetical protein A1O9_09871 [Exophiala aquamarina CBS 119918]